MSVYLYDVQTGRDYAYTTDGKNFYLSRRSSWWAYQSGQYLYDAKTGRAIAYWSGKYLYDATTGKALWYKT